MRDWIDDVEAFLVSVAPLEQGDRVMRPGTSVTGEILSRKGESVYEVYWGTSDNGPHITHESRDDLEVAQTLPA